MIRVVQFYLVLMLGVLMLLSHAKAQDVYPGIPYSFALHQLCEEHYYHAKLSAFQCYQRLGFVEDSLNMCLGEEEVPTAPLGCEVFEDWGGGALWKPVRDGGGPPVFLLQTSYCDGGSAKISNVKLLSEAGVEVSSTSFRHCNRANGGRLHWNVSTLASQLKGPLILQYEFEGTTECRSIPNPESRYD